MSISTTVPEPAPTRRLIEDPEFIRDCFAFIGRVATYADQHRAIMIVRLVSGTLISCGSEVGILIDSDGNLVSGHIAKLRMDDDRQRHGAIWTAVTGLLDRHEVT